MNGAWAAIAYAVELIPKDCLEAKFYLEDANDLAFLYQETWHSIRWNAATVGKRKSVQYRLDEIAYNAYSALISGAQALNTYVEDGNESPENWGELIHSMNAAYRRLHAEHSHQLNQRQMTLPLDGQPINLPLNIKVPELILITSEKKQKHEHHYLPQSHL
jgi:hypothetical protein